MQRFAAIWFWQFVVVLCMLASSGCGDPEVAAMRQSDQLYVDAASAQKAGDNAKALELYSQALTVKASGHAYLARAKLHLSMDNDAGAKADVDAGLTLDPENRDLMWLRGELNKPAKKRFTGAAAEPPSASK